MQDSRPQNDYTHLIHEINASDYTKDALEALKLRLEDKIKSPRRTDNINDMPSLLRVLEKRYAIDFSILQIIAEESDSARARAISSNRGVSDEIPPDVVQLLSNEITHNWFRFARYLEIAESTIDELEATLPRCSDRIREVLRLFQNSNTCWRVKVLESLDRLERNDLILKIRCRI